MASYNKPGVYVEESLTPNLPVAEATGDSVAVFIGVADRGPTTGTDGSSIVSVPTLVSDWSSFVNTFSFGSVVNTFDSTVGTAANNLKYAVKSFFDNGGSQAYIVRVVQKASVRAKASIRDQAGTLTQAASWEFDGTSVTSTNGSVKITASTGTPFTTAEVGRTISFSGITATGYTGLAASGTKWVISDVDSGGTWIKVLYRNATAPTVATQSGTGITTVGGTISATAAINVYAKDAGAWGGTASSKSLWVSITPNQIENYFDLTVYYSARGAVSGSSSVSADLIASDIVEKFTNLSMNTTDARYVTKVVNSSWITVEDPNPSTSTTKLPAFTGQWSYVSTGLNTDSSTGKFVWNSGGFSNTTVSANPRAVRLGLTSTSTTSLAGTAGADTGATPGTAADIMPLLDSKTLPLIINYPGVTATTDVNAMTAYAATRGDSFVIIDADPTSVSTALATIAGYTSNLNYGAAYYPNIVIADPASTTGGTKSVAPGGAVAALYTSTDATRGVFKAPAGAYSRVSNAVSVASLTNSEFDLVSNATVNLNIIRSVPGSGICVMGARTLASNTVDKFVPVRRTLNYLAYNLKAITLFAVFEPNDQNLWSSVSGVVNGFLDSFWKSGGLYGATREQAYFVKCDATTNTPAAIAAGELRIEIGVALQRPAEFVIIKIGQIDGGATVTTSV